MNETTITILRIIVYVGVVFVVIVSVLILATDVIQYVRHAPKKVKEKELRMPSSVDTMNMEGLLETLSSAETSCEKAEAYIKLLENGYVTIHRIINEGGKYSDTQQSVRFIHFLSPVALNKINNLDGNNS